MFLAAPLFIQHTMDTLTNSLLDLSFVSILDTSREIEGEREKERENKKEREWLKDERRAKRKTRGRRWQEFVAKEADTTFLQCLALNAEVRH
jgi:hypothetical protein